MPPATPQPPAAIPAGETTVRAAATSRAASRPPDASDTTSGRTALVTLNRGQRPSVPNRYSFGAAGQWLLPAGLNPRFQLTLIHHGTPREHTVAGRPGHFRRQIGRRHDHVLALRKCQLPIHPARRAGIENLGRLQSIADQPQPRSRRIERIPHLEHARPPAWTQESRPENPADCEDCSSRLPGRQWRFARSIA